MNYRYLMSAIAMSCILSSRIDAHTYTFTNNTRHPVTLDFCGLAVIGCSMMQGKIPAWHGGGHEVTFDEDSNTTSVRNAGHLKAPYRLPAQHTVMLNFNGIDFGICIDTGAIKINGITRPVKPLDANQYDAVSERIKNAGKTVGGIEPYVSWLPGKAGEYSKLATQTGHIVLTGVSEILRISPCKNMSFM